MEDIMSYAAAAICTVNIDVKFADAATSWPVLTAPLSKAMMHCLLQGNALFLVCDTWR